jgi:hypothetical protein
VISSGGFFAYVEFPPAYANASSAIGLKRKQLGSEDVARVMGERLGVATLPGSFFMPDIESDVWDEIVDGEVLRQDRWLRCVLFSIADLGDTESR